MIKIYIGWYIIIQFAFATLGAIYLAEHMLFTPVKDENYDLKPRQGRDGFISFKMEVFEYQAAKFWNLDAVLLDTLCKWETEPSVYTSRDTLITRGEMSIGRCQVRVTTALWLRGIKRNKQTRRFPPGVYKATLIDLKNPRVNTFHAAQYLSLCLDKKKGNIERALYCYNAGLNSRFPGPTKYTRTILSRYRRRLAKGE